MTLRLGVIGLSEGNGHPYSWSGIINGYSVEAMHNCGFPVIPKYLSEQRWPDARIRNAEVTHVWTDSREISDRVARASLIRNIVDTPGEMLGNIDALLLARDDAENHMHHAAPFLKAGIPVYIDKPVALSVDAMNALYDLQRFDGQIFTCSALRYAKELVLSSEDRDAIGNIRFIQASTPKSWDKYASHIIEPVLNILSYNAESVEINVNGFGDDARCLTVKFSDGVVAQFNSLGEVAAPISIRVYGDAGWRELIFSDAFHSFKLALQDFIDGVLTRTCRTPRAFTKRVVLLIEAGRVL